MSTRTGAQAVWGWQRNLAAAAVAVAVSVGLTEVALHLPARYPPILVVGALLGVAAILLVHAAPYSALLSIALVRGAVEGMQDKVLLHVGGIGLSPPDLLSLAFLAGAAWWTLDRLLTGELSLFRTPLLLPAGLLVAVGALSLVHSASITVGARDLVKFCTAIAAYVVLAGLNPDARRLRLLLWAVLLGSIVPIAVGWWQFGHHLGHFSLHSGNTRVQSTFTHPNTFGFFLVAIFAVAWGLRFVTTGPARVFVLGMLILAFLTAFIPLSRTAWAALAIVIVVLGLRNRRFILGMIVLGGLTLAALPTIVTRALAALQSGSGGGATIGDRVHTWLRSLALYVHGNPVLGIGWGSAQLDLDKATHNDYLRVLLAAGPIGLVLFLWLLLAVVRRARIAAWWRTDFPRAFYGFAIAYFLMSFFTNNLSKAAFQFYFWLLAGITFAWPRAMAAEEATATPAVRAPV